MSIRENFDISAYLVVGPENTKGRPVKEIISAAISAGFSCIQIRSKVASAIELIEMTRQAASVIASAGKSEKVALLVDDRLDVVLAARKLGIKVDGIHVGQTDIPVDICREYLGESLLLVYPHVQMSCLNILRRWMSVKLIILALVLCTRRRQN